MTLALVVPPLHAGVVAFIEAVSSSGIVKTICLVLDLEHWSVTVTVTVVSAEISVPATGLCVIVSSAFAVQLSEDIARTSSVRFGTMNTQSVDVSSRSRSSSPIVGAV